MTAYGLICLRFLLLCVLYSRGECIAINRVPIIYLRFHERVISGILQTVSDSGSYVITEMEDKALCREIHIFISTECFIPVHDGKRYLGSILREYLPHSIGIITAFDNLHCPVDAAS